jgi:SAM-dependent methyltransferase
MTHDTKDEPLYENDKFWDNMASSFFSEARLAATPVETDHIISLLNLNPGASVLDLCCGPGRHSLELARRNYHITGVDRTVQYLEKARARAEREGLTIEFVKGDMRHFCRPEAFDSVLLMYTSFGYFETQEENRQVLINVYNSLTHGGTLLIDLKGKEVLARIFTEREWREQDGVFILEEREIDNWTRVKNRWIIFDDQGRHEFTFTIWIYSAQELSSLLRECGFASVNVYGNLEGAPYDHTARRLVVVAEKE